LLQTCLKSIHERTRQYYYRITAEKNIPGCLSFLLSITEADIVEIFKICGFYNEKKITFPWNDFDMWVAASFKKGTMEFTKCSSPEARNKKIPLLNLGTGTHPIWPGAQVKEKLDPPSFQMQSAEGQSSKDSLMALFGKPPGTALFDIPPSTKAAAIHTNTETTAATNTATAAAASTLIPVKLSLQFKISSPTKSRLVMELIYMMATPQKVPLMRELVKGSTLSVQTHTNQSKKYVHIPKCSSEASATCNGASREIQIYSGDSGYTGSRNQTGC
jgi:hypothetical protein